MKKLFIILIIVLGTIIKISAQNPDPGRIFQALLEKKDTVVFKEGGKTIVVDLKNVSLEKKEGTTTLLEKLTEEKRILTSIVVIFVIVSFIIFITKKIPEGKDLMPNHYDE